MALCINSIVLWSFDCGHCFKCFLHISISYCVCSGSCLQPVAHPVESNEIQQSTKQRTKFDPSDWFDNLNDLPETPQPLRCFTAGLLIVGMHCMLMWRRPGRTNNQRGASVEEWIVSGNNWSSSSFLSSPKYLKENYGIVQDLRVVLTRTPSPSSASTVSSFITRVQYKSFTHMHVQMFFIS